MQDGVHRERSAYVVFILAAVFAGLMFWIGHRPALPVSIESPHLLIVRHPEDSEGRALFEFKNQTSDPDLMLLVTIEGTPPPWLAYEINPDGTPVWNEIAYFVSRAPPGTAIRLPLNIDGIVQTDWRDLRVAAQIARAAEVVIYERSDVKGGGKVTSRDIGPTDVFDELRGANEFRSIAPEAQSLGFAPATGYCRIAVSPLESVARIEIQID